MKISRIMLISPPMTILRGSLKSCPVPLGIAYLGAVLLKEGYAVQLLDAAIEDVKHGEQVDASHFRYGLSLAEIEKRIRQFSPQVVGITSLFSGQFKNVLLVSRLVKNLTSPLLRRADGYFFALMLFDSWVLPA